MSESGRAADANGNEWQLRKNWPGAVAVCAFFFLVAIVSLVAVHKYGDRDTQRLAMVFDTVILIGCALGCWGPLAQMFTEIDKEGLSQPSLWGRVRIAWSDVTSVTYQGHTLVVRSSQHRLRLNPFLLGGSRLVSTIHQRTGI